VDDGTHDVTFGAGVRPGDLGELIALHGRLYAEEYGWDAGFEAYVAQALAELVLAPEEERHRLWIARQRGDIIGSVGIIGRDERTAQLRCFLVHPAARGHGIGTELLSRALAFSQKQGYASVFLWTTRDLAAAGRLYEAAGFTLTEEVTHVVWGATVTEQRYDLRLGPPSCG
jgi:N-acetylglutamate synthase-like GNAT family acetyltransferase